jgi:hypothetical protein
MSAQTLSAFLASPAYLAYKANPELFHNALAMEKSFGGAPPAPAAAALPAPAAAALPAPALPLAASPLGEPAPKMPKKQRKPKAPKPEGSGSESESTGWNAHWENVVANMRQNGWAAFTDKKGVAWSASVKQGDKHVFSSGPKAGKEASFAAGGSNLASLSWETKKTKAVKKLDLALDLWAHEGAQLYKNERGDVLSVEGEWVGHWDGASVVPTPEPADFSQLFARE